VYQDKTRDGGEALLVMTAPTPPGIDRAVATRMTQAQGLNSGLRSFYTDPRADLPWACGRLINTAKTAQTTGGFRCIASTAGFVFQEHP
jgi:hypothetical protein